jgi:dipeptidyl aminopeptidase/acylaminoacyl peptidase
MMMKQPLSLVACLAVGSAVCAQSAVALSSERAADREAQLPSAKLFAPGIISGSASDGSPTFTPDGDTLFFTRSASRWSIILESHRLQGKWSDPEIASFSGKWSDSSPALSPDGSSLVFVSVRPDTSPSAIASKRPGHAASHIWKSTRTGSSWGEPVELPATVNFCADIFRPSVAADGSLYFTAAGQGKELRLFRSAYVNGAYEAAEPLPFSDGTLKDVDPEIAPDQSFLIFTRMLADAPHEKLFIVHNHAGAWGKVEPLHYQDDEANGSSDDNDPRLGSDHRTLYFSSDRSAAVHFPRSQEQAREDLDRLQNWDNGATNIWFFPITL